MKHLAKFDEQFRSIANSAPIPMWISDLDNKRIFVNQSYTRFLGVGYEEALTFDWRTILHPDDLPRILDEGLAGAAMLGPFAFEARYCRRHGPWRWIRSESELRWDTEGNQIGFFGIIRDITLSKRAENELRHLNQLPTEVVESRKSKRQRNKSRLRAIIAIRNSYPWLIDLAGNVIYARTALERFRAMPEDVFGMPFWDSPWFSGTEGVREAIFSSFYSIVQGECMRLKPELMLNLPNGNRIFNFKMRPIIDPKRVIVGVFTEAVNVTELREPTLIRFGQQAVDIYGASASSEKQTK
jgi:PAS domain S-box-containing protein